MDGNVAMKNARIGRNKKNFRTKVVYADRGQWQGFSLLADLIVEEIMRRREAQISDDTFLPTQQRSSNEQ